ncbi:MAG: S1C family serine protease [Nocardioidaceae bacterium]
MSDQPDDPSRPPQPGYPPPYPFGAPQGPWYLQRQPEARVAGWVWPVIAVTALVVGLLGGVIGGVAVSRSMQAGGSIQVVDAHNGAKSLKPANGSVAAVAAKVVPSTVQVNANGGVAGGRPGGATGSGFVADRQGHVITNNHVVADATGDGQLKVVDRSGHTHDATIVGRSEVYDIAVLSVQGGAGLPPAPLGSSHSTHVGDTVVAVGSPLGLSGTVTSGIVSALDRPVTTTGENNQASYIDAVQTDAAINPGSSGGPLVNMRGQVIGVNSAIATAGDPLSGQSGNIGVGFAIPMEQVQLTASQILRTGEAKYPIIGANVNITGVGSRGATLTEVPSGTPADRAGLHKGDLVVGVDHTAVSNGIDLIVAIRTHRPGQTITLVVLRHGARRRIAVTLDAKVG